MLQLAFYGNTVQEYLISLGIIVGGVILGKIAYFILENIVKKLTEKTNTNFDDIVIQTIEKPGLLAIFTFTLYFATHRLVLPLSVTGKVDALTKVLVIVTGTWLATGFVDRIIEHYLTPLVKKAKTGADVQLIPVIRKTAFWLIVVFAALSVLSNLGINVSSLLAGLGLGGLAFALAAEKSLGNIFGGVTILLDGPFKLRERIKIKGHEGYVREIGLRSTKLESLDGPIVTVPNSLVVNETIENVTKRQKRRVKVTLGLTYDTTKKGLEKAKKILGEILEKHKEVSDYKTAFLAFNASSLDIFAIYWIPKADNLKLLTVTHEVNMQILKRFNKAKLSFAFPTQTIEARKVK